MIPKSNDVKTVLKVNKSKCSSDMVRRCVSAGMSTHFVDVVYNTFGLFFPRSWS